MQTHCRLIERPVKNKGIADDRENAEYEESLAHSSAFVMLIIRVGSHRRGFGKGKGERVLISAKS